MRLNPYARLTVWYVAILMGLSLAFSAWVYNEAMGELRNGFNGPVVQRLQDRYGPLPPDVWVQVIEKQYQAARGRIIGQLIILNVTVLAIGAAASYWLAKRTMRPIEHALEAQNRFTADASHELRTPLAAMKTEIEVSLRDPTLSKDEMRELLQSNLEEINRMSELAQGLLTLARHPEKLRLSPQRLAPIAETVIKRFTPLAEAKHITITKTLSGDVTVLGEEKSVTALVGILLDNAIKYSLPHTRIEVTVERKDNYGLVTVADHGPGIAEEDLPHIFDRFYRADSSRTKENVAGNGLGLSIAQKTVAALKGSITARSEVGKGSTFILRLPKAA
jgi:two-component system, OmpR family, sensor histidine kinase CiaH